MKCGRQTIEFAPAQGLIDGAGRVKPFPRPGTCDRLPENLVEGSILIVGFVHYELEFERAGDIGEGLVFPKRHWIIDTVNVPSQGLRSRLRIYGIPYLERIRIVLNPVA